MPNIFINYRREDSEAAVGHIADKLRAHFGPDSIFIDRYDIPIGQDFRGYLDDAVSRCDVMLVIIGQGWLDAKDTNQRQRLDDANDFVRIEIESALRREIPVVPVLVKRGELPNEGELPKVLKSLVYRQGLECRPGPGFDGQVKKLCDAITATAGPDQSIKGPTPDRSPPNDAGDGDESTAGLSLPGKVVAGLSLLAIVGGLVALTSDLEWSPPEQPPPSDVVDPEPVPVKTVAAESQLDQLETWPQHPLRDFLERGVREAEAERLTELFGRSTREIPGMLSPRKGAKIEADDLRPWWSGYRIQADVKDGKKRDLFVVMEFSRSIMEDKTSASELAALTLKFRLSGANLKDELTAILEEPETVTEFNGAEAYRWLDGGLVLSLREMPDKRELTIMPRQQLERRQARTQAMVIPFGHYLNAKKHLLGGKLDIQASLRWGMKALDGYKAANLFHGDTVVNLCHTLYRLERMAEAGDLCELTIQRASSPSVRSEARYYLARIKLRAGDRAGGIKLLNEATEEGISWGSAGKRVRLLLKFLNGDSNKTELKSILRFDACERAKKLGNSHAELHLEFGLESREQLHEIALQAGLNVGDIVKRETNRCEIR